MSKQKFIEAMGYVDERILERYIKEEDQLSGKKVSKRKPLLHWAAVAACLALLAVAGIYGSQTPDIPTFDGPVYSATEIARLFGGKNDAGLTNSYTKVYAPDGASLQFSDIPKQDYLSIYHYTQSTAELDQAEFQHLLDGILPRLATALGSDVPEYTIVEDDRDPSLEMRTKGESITLSASQDRSCYRFYLSAYTSDEPYQGIYLNGKRVEIDQRQSDEEIIASLSSLRETLLEIFGVSFLDVKIVRSFEGYYSHAAASISIFFYNENDHPLNTIRQYPVSDYIHIYFDNNYNSAGDTVSDSILYKVMISYHKLRSDPEQEYQEIKTAKMISLADAEALLYNGYVFGGHSCKLCMAAQDKISFKGYDYAGFEYVFGRTSDGTLADGVPFYTFYKQIGTAKNGNLIYAKTYVPAIEVSGYEDYFESQTEKHNTYWTNPG